MDFSQELNFNGYRQWWGCCACWISWTSVLRSEETTVGLIADLFCFSRPKTLMEITPAGGSSALLSIGSSEGRARLAQVVSSRLCLCYLLYLSLRTLSTRFTSREIGLLLPTTTHHSRPRHRNRTRARKPRATLRRVSSSSFQARLLPRRRGSPLTYEESAMDKESFGEGRLSDDVGSLAALKKAFTESAFTIAADLPSSLDSPTM